MYFQKRWTPEAAVYADIITEHDKLSHSELATSMAKQNKFALRHKPMGDMLHLIQDTDENLSLACKDAPCSDNTQCTE